MTLVLVGVIIGVALVPMAKAWVRSTGHRPAALRSSESVNVFNGTVFPAPHDARWRRVEANDGSGAEVFIFGDSDIRLSSQTLRVNDMMLAGSGQATVAYYSDVQRCYYAFKQTLALQSVEMAILHAGFGVDDGKRTEAREELPAPPIETAAAPVLPCDYRIGAFTLPRPDDPKWLEIGGDEYRYFYDDVRCLTVSLGAVVFGVAGRPDDRSSAVVCTGPEAALYAMGIERAKWASGQQGHRPDAEYYRLLANANANVSRGRLR